MITRALLTLFPALVVLPCVFPSRCHGQTASELVEGYLMNMSSIGDYECVIQESLVRNDGPNSIQWNAVWEVKEAPAIGCYRNGSTREIHYEEEGQMLSEVSTMHLTMTPDNCLWHIPGATLSESSTPETFMTVAGYRSPVAIGMIEFGDFARSFKRLDAMLVSRLDPTRYSYAIRRSATDSSWHDVLMTPLNTTANMRWAIRFSASDGWMPTRMTRFLRFGDGGRGAIDRVTEMSWVENDGLYLPIEISFSHRRFGEGNVPSVVGGATMTWLEVGANYTVDEFDPLQFPSMMDAVGRDAIIGPTPSIEEVLVGDGVEESRSEVTEISVAFNTEVQATETAFILRNLTTSTDVTSVQTVSTVSNEKTTVTLTFADGPSVVTRANGNTLADGQYALVIVGDEVIGMAGGQPMPSDVAFVGIEDKLFRRYGDTNGDAICNINDFVDDFLPAYDKSAGDVGFRRDLDFNGDDVINITDFVEGFLPNYGVSF